MSMMTPEYARRTFTPVSWMDRRERTHSDYELGQVGDKCGVCRAPWTQFVHSETNCRKEIAKNITN